MNEATQAPDLSAVSKLLQLESMARAASSKQALSFMIVNETRRLLNYRQAYLFLSTHPIQRKCDLVAASSVAVVETNAPFAIWMNKLKKQLFDSNTINKQKQIDQSQCPQELLEGWGEFSLPFVLWTPLKLPDGTFVGGLWLTRENPWQDNEMALLKRLGETYAHAMIAVTSRRSMYKRPTVVKVAIWVIVFFLLAVLLKPIQLTALAPAEITAIEPEIISSPMDGVIADVYYPPNSYVAKDDILFSLEDTNLRNEYNVVEKTLAVAEAELKKASQDAFRDAKSKAQVALLEAETKLQETKLAFAKEMLEKVQVKADRSGLLIYADKSDWIGKPVQVGERIMEIADPQMIQLRINLPIDDAIVLNKDAEVDVFLDADPIHPVAAKVTSTSYIAEKYDQETLSYRVYAKFNESENDSLRIGLQGTAKIYGENVSVFFYLFRRPISYVRQFIGL